MRKAVIRIAIMHLGLIACIARAEFSSDTLSGDLHGIIPNTGRPYFVTADIAVPVGETVTLEPGVTLLFNEFTGLQVHGTLVAKGTDNNQIYFSSAKDRALSGATDTIDAAPYDWNGILINENALGTSFDRCVISYSLYGLKSLTKHITVKSTVFFRNGKSNMSISGTEMKVGEAPFNYALTTPTAESGTVPGMQPAVQQKVRRGKPVLTVGGGVLLAAGLATGIWKTLDYFSSVERFNKLNTPQDPANLQKFSIEQEWEAAKAEKNRNLVFMATGYAAALLGAVCITISF